MAAEPPSKEEKTKKLSYKCLFIFLAICVVSLTWGQTYFDSQEKDNITQLNSNQLYSVQMQLSSESTSNAIARSNSDARINTLQRILMTNSSSAIGDLIIADKMNEVSQEQVKIMQEQKIITESPVTPKSLRSARSARLKLEILSNQYVELEKERNAIRMKKEEKQADNQQEIEAEKRRKEALATHQHLTKQCLEVFDYAIYKLHEMLNSVASDTRDTIDFNFPNITAPYSPSLMSEQETVKITNFVKLNGNSGWEFNVLAEPSYISSHGYWDRYKDYHSPTLSIIGTSNRWESKLVIQPFVNQGWPETHKPTNFATFTIHLSTNNSLIIDNNVDFAEYKIGVDEAIRRMLETQDSQSPLKTNIP